MSSYTPPSSGAARLLRSLGHPDYARYFAGQAVSLTGTWMQHTAQAWLVYRLTGSSFWLGLVAFAGMLPVLLIGIPAGHLADRVNRHRLMVATQSLALLQAAVLAWLTLGGTVSVGAVLALAMGLGVTQALEMPSRHSFLPTLVPRDDLPNAIALNAALFNASRFLGPALAGGLIAVVGEGGVFLINAASFVAVLAALLSMSEGVRRPPHRPVVAREGFWAGPRYVLGRRELRRVFQLVVLASLLGLPFTVLLPVVAREIHDGGPELLGLLMAANGGGALVAAGVLAFRGRGQGLERTLGGAAALAGSALLLFATGGPLAVAASLLVLVGFAFTFLVASCNTSVQMQIPDRLRGRVMSLYSVLFVGLFPFGQLLAGSLGELLGVRATIALLGGCCAAGGLAFLATRRRLPASDG